MIRRELCLEAKVSDSRNSSFFQELYLAARNLVEKFRRGQSQFIKIGLLKNCSTAICFLSVAAVIGSRIF